MVAAQKRRILITPALPYANGEVHVGHASEHLMVDFWARFQRMRGHECLTICGADTHGTPIMLKAQELKMEPLELIKKMKEDHYRDFSALGISYDHYGSTHSETNKELCNYFYQQLRDHRHLDSRIIDQYYCDHDRMFLPDRYIKGTCPKCKAPDQYGDNCTKCGATYQPAEMTEVRCSLCSKQPVIKASEHLFIRLEDFRDFLASWLKTATEPEIYNKMSEWLSQPLRSWDISRDEPYFGFPIPDRPGKFFYVWLDAPMGYVAATKEWCTLQGRNLDDFWGEKHGAEIYHCVGKDVAYFHCLFWPAILHNAAYKTPKKIVVHGYVNINGERMSKSTGNYFSIRDYVNKFDPIYLRYYYACKINGSIDDFDFNLDDFASRVNSDLIGKITNIASRGCQLLQKYFAGKLGILDDEGKTLLDGARQKQEIIAECYEKFEFSKAMLIIREIADDVNKYIDLYSPWKLINTDPKKTHVVLTTILNCFRVVTIYLRPILPDYSAKVEKLFGESSAFWWGSIEETKENNSLLPYEHLLTRINGDEVKTLLNKNTELSSPLTTQKSAPKDKTNSFSKEAKKEVIEGNTSTMISIDEFAKVDLRVGKVLTAQAVEGAQKLLQLTVDLGDHQRQIFSGIKSCYEANDLLGKMVVVVCNLAPRKMKFGISEGMILAAGDSSIQLLTLDPGAKPGDKIS